MIKVIEGDLLHAKSQIIVQLVNEDGDLHKNIPDYINNDYHHITKEYIKYINFCRKKNREISGSCVYIPLDVWALGLVDTTKNNYIDTYDKDFKYIASAFALEKVGKKYKVNISALKECLTDICMKAQSVHADVVIMYSDIVYKIVQEVCENSSVNIYLVKED